MNRYRTHSITFKKQVAQDLAGETLKGLAKRHDISRNLIRLWVVKHETGEFGGDTEAVDRLQEYEARIAALERLVDKLTLENEFLKGASKDRRSPTSGTMSIVSGPKAFPSDGYANS
jgi:transposase